MTVVLVTGGCGYLGSALIRRLAIESAFEGMTIRILDNMFREKYSSLWGLPTTANYHFIEGSILDLETVKKAMEDVEIVFSLADITNAPLSFKRQKLTWQTNYLGAMNVFNAALERASVKKFVYTSTCSVYGPTTDRVDEDSPCEPVSPYGQSKLAAEAEMMVEADQLGFDWTALRLATVHGWTQGMRLDTVVNRFAYLASQGVPLQVYESAWKEKRPYVHESDVMDAYVLAATGKTKGEVYNVVGVNADMEAVIRAIKFAAWWHLLPVVQVETVKTPSLNQLSYEVDGSKFGECGFFSRVPLQAGPMGVMKEFARIAPIGRRREML